MCRGQDDGLIFGCVDACIASPGEDGRRAVEYTGGIDSWVTRWSRHGDKRERWRMRKVYFREQRYLRKLGRSSNSGGDTRRLRKNGLGKGETLGHRFRVVREA